jgi:Leucine-rich repeat (LRR) protein
MPAKLTPQLLDLPPAWLALLIHHVASGPGVLANAAALGHSCKFLHSLSEGLAVTYSNLCVAAAISSPDHPFWQWLARRSGRIAGLTLKLRLTNHVGQLSGWRQPLQTLSRIPDVQLRFKWVGSIADVGHPCISQWLQHHVQLISHLTLDVEVSRDRLKLRDVSEAAAPCRAIDLRIWHSTRHVVDLADLQPVASSLHSLTCQPSPSDQGRGSLRGTIAFSSMSQLTTLHMHQEDLRSEEPWGVLSRLTSLQQLYLRGTASGDPSPLSALTGLSRLRITTFGELEADGPAPFTFTSLQPLSTLQQLEELHLGGKACAATSLQGLAGLSKLTKLVLDFLPCGELISLEGISPGVKEVSIVDAPNLMGLTGIEICTSMETLTLCKCHVPSLQPLKGLSQLKEVKVSKCGMTSLAGLNSSSLLSLRLDYCGTLFRLSGVEHLSALKSLEVVQCRYVGSLQPLSQLGKGLQLLAILGCNGVQEEVLELPHVQPTAEVHVLCAPVREVVLAGGSIVLKPLRAGSGLICQTKHTEGMSELWHA